VFAETFITKDIQYSKVLAVFQFTSKISRSRPSNPASTDHSTDVMFAAIEIEVNKSKYLSFSNLYRVLRFPSCLGGFNPSRRGLPVFEHPTRLRLYHAAMKQTPFARSHDLDAKQRRRNSLRDAAKFLALIAKLRFRYLTIARSITTMKRPVDSVERDMD